MKAITNPLELAHKAAEEYRACYGDDLVSVLLYGSAAGDHFDPKRSDINLLIVITSASLPALERSSAIQERWLARRFARPLFMDKEYIAGSLDSFPIEFMNMKACYKVLAGEDVLAGLRIDPRNLRLQLERELKGKLLHLLREWLHVKRRPRLIEHLLAASMRDFAAAFRALLQLKGRQAPVERVALFAAVEDACGLDGRPFQETLAAYRSGDRRRMAAVFPAYAEAIRKQVALTDKE